MEVGNESKIIRYFISDNYLSTLLHWGIPRFDLLLFKKNSLFAPGFSKPIGYVFHHTGRSIVHPISLPSGVLKSIMRWWRLGSVNVSRGIPYISHPPPDFTSKSDEKFHPSSPQNRPSFRFPPTLAYPASDRPSKSICQCIFLSPFYAKFSQTEHYMLFSEMFVLEFRKFEPELRQGLLQ